MNYKHKRTLPRKRIRGLRRLFRQHQRWAAVPQEFSLSLLKKYYSNTEQLGIAPWTVHGKPPRAIRQLWANRLLTDFFEWQQQLTALYPEFWLSIRLYDPRFGLSELDAAIQEEKAYYERRYRNEYEEKNRPLPPEFLSIPGAAQLRWACHAVVDVFDPEEFAEHYAWYKRKPHWAAKDTNGGECVVVQTGYVWVGRAPTPSAR